MFTNYNMKCVHCKQPVDFEEQVYCEDCSDLLDSEYTGDDYEQEEDT